MVLQQCLACNVVVPGSCRSCICGHVFDEIKQIGGKRFSGYRAELYTRLETRRMKDLTKPKRQIVELGSSDEENMTDNKLQDFSKPKKIKTAFSTDGDCAKKPKRRKHKKLRRSRSPASKLSSIARQEREQVPAEVIERFPEALAEINRRLFGQNLMWAGL